MVVVFVHGILSSSESCWQHDNGAFWPDLLAGHPSLENVGIYEFTYQTGIFSGSYSLGNVVDALKESLNLDGVVGIDRIVFVAHSMGGIVVRRYIVQQLGELVERGTEIGLFLIASPSLGASYATWLAPLARFFGHAQGTALAFCEANTWLNDLNTDFRNMLAREKLIVHGKELVEDRFVVLRRFRLFNQVVPPFSGATYFGDPFKVPGSDHFSISKPDNAESIQNRLLCQFIIGIMESEFDPNKISEGNGELRTIVSGCEICVMFGRIEDYPAQEGTIIALPCNEYFDDDCTEDTRSALGAYVGRYYGGRASDFSDLVQSECGQKFGQGAN